MIESPFPCGSSTAKLKVQDDLKASARVNSVRIREAADLLGVEPHVLRHWEDESVLVPARAANNYRDYDEEALTRARVVLGCRAAGLSLAQTRLVIHRDEPGREEVIRDQHRRVEQQLNELGLIRVFSEHVLDCRHSLMSRCPGCARYATTVSADEE